jgi:hypothetical protein
MRGASRKRRTIPAVRSKLLFTKLFVNLYSPRDTRRGREKDAGKFCESGNRLIAAPYA